MRLRACLMLLVAAAVSNADRAPLLPQGAARALTRCEATCSSAAPASSAAPSAERIDLGELPGFTRSVVAADHALVTPESRVYFPLLGWRNTQGAVLVSPHAMGGAHFTMYALTLGANSSSALPLPGVERFVFVLAGELSVAVGGSERALGPDDFAYFPPGEAHAVGSASGASLLLYEQRYVEPVGAAAEAAGGRRPRVQVGSTGAQPELPVEGEVFGLRKLLPASAEYDFNMHVMTFEPGEFLAVKEVHYNQHGLLLLEGRGIYRLADRWYPVAAGDAIWMAPYVVQWYAALGRTRSRYIINKDTSRDPLHASTPR